MRRVSKIQLLLAPVLLAASVGCATSGYTSSCANQSGQTGYAATRTDRTDKLLSIAAYYEQAGRPELAYKMYKHLHDQHPDNTIAQERMASLSNQHSKMPGVERTHLNPQERMMASQEKPAAIPKRQSQNALQTPAKPPGEPKLNLAWDAPDARTAQLELVAAREMPVTQLPSSATAIEKLLNHEFFVDEPVARVEKTVNPENPEWLAETFVDDSLEVSKAQELAQCPAVERTEIEVAEELFVWASAESIAEFAPEKQEVSSRWTPTSKEHNASEDPAQLEPQVKKLASSEVSVRIEGLQELRQMGTAAEFVNQDVRNLLADSSPLVQAHAAVALHSTTGEASESVSTLVTILESDSAEAVRLASYLLGNMGPAAIASQPQLEIIRDRDTDVTSLHAAEALIRITPNDDQSFDKLKIALFGSDVDARWFAAVSLGAVTEQHQLDSAKALKEALNDGESKVRAAAALSLGGLGESSRIAVTELQHAAKYDIEEVRDAAAMALACIAL